MTWWRRLLGGDRRVSDQWLVEQARTSATQGIDSVAWTFPVRKIVNEHAGFNTARLRVRETRRIA